MNIVRASKKNVSDLVFLNSFVQEMHTNAHQNIFKPVENGIGIHEYFGSVLDKNKNCILIAYISEAPVGYIWASFEDKPESPFTYPRKLVYIHHISVHIDYRRQKIGGTLFSELKSLAFEKEFENFTTDTWNFNKNAQTFFNKIGFETYNVKLWHNCSTDT